MKKLYSLVILLSFLLMTAQAAFLSKNVSFMPADGATDSAKKVPSKSISKITDTRAGKPSEIKSVKINIPPYKPAVKAVPNSTPQVKNTGPDSKILSNVKIYPNPVADHLNLSYFVNKDSNVTIKIMDVLGNEVITLLSQRLSAGEQTNSFQISSSLNSGYYFVRFMVAGGEPIVKRISVL